MGILSSSFCKSFALSLGGLGIYCLSKSADPEKPVNLDLGLVSSSALEEGNTITSYIPKSNDKYEIEYMGKVYRKDWRRHEKFIGYLYDISNKTTGEKFSYYKILYGDWDPEKGSDSNSLDKFIISGELTVRKPFAWKQYYEIS